MLLDHLARHDFVDDALDERSRNGFPGPLARSAIDERCLLRFEVINQLSQVSPSGFDAYRPNDSSIAHSNGVFRIVDIHPCAADLTSNPASNGG